MKKYILLILLLCTFSSNRLIFSQVNLNGWWQSNLYILENDFENRQYNYYQGLQFRLSPQKLPNLYINSYLRVAHRGDPADWDERVHNLYLNWDINRNYRVRLGRQFLYHGVINGTMDVVKLSGRFAKNLQVHGVAGMVAPYSNLQVPFNKKFDIMDWDKGNVLGGYASYMLPGRNRLDLSYFQKRRLEDFNDPDAEEKLYWQQLGSSISGVISEKLNYYLRFDYNLLAEDYQALRARLTYLRPKWSLSAEFNSQRPRIFEDSFFNIFKINAYNQIRGAFNYYIQSDIYAGLQLLRTVYDVHKFYILFKDDNDFRAVGSVGHKKFGQIGIIVQTGSVSENVGYFADLRYEVIPGLTARFFNSYYNYERASINISQDALAFMAGLRYRVSDPLLLDAELQQSSNNIYKNDLRGLFRLTYLFNL